jgi:hypothetical protein
LPEQILQILPANVEGKVGNVNLSATASTTWRSSIAAAATGSKASSSSSSSSHAAIKASA